MSERRERVEPDKRPFDMSAADTANICLRNRMDREYDDCRLQDHLAMHFCCDLSNCSTADLGMCDRLDSSEHHE